MSNNVKTFIALLIIAALTTLLVISVYDPDGDTNRQLESIYQTGIIYLNEGCYEAAYREFARIIADYKDSKNLRELCNGMYLLEKGNYKAWNSLCRVKVDETVLLYVPDFEKRKEQSHTLYEKGMEEKAALEAEELRKNGIPYIGMEESKIAKTSLGISSEKYEYLSSVDGKQVEKHKYIWKKNGYIIFTAFCYGGYVWSVWDDRDSPYEPYDNYSYSSGSSSDDEFDVDFFENAEDFYDHYYDDFIDYYEAEDYFEEHKK